MSNLWRVPISYYWLSGTVPIDLQRQKNVSGQIANDPEIYEDLDAFHL